MVKKVGRSTLPKAEARQHYIELGEGVVLEQIQRDSKRLGKEAIAVGPFARLDASVVAAKDGKTRGAVTNLFGSQAAFQTEMMAYALRASDLIEGVQFPSPSDYASAEEWVQAFFTSQSARGPRHKARPNVNYGSLWALWLSAVPYGLWSDEISGPSMDEYILWVHQLERVFNETLRHFKLELRAEVTINDLACSVASLIDGVWLNQCLTNQHPCDAAQPIATALCRAGTLLWNGALDPDRKS